MKELLSHLPSTSQNASDSSVSSFLSCEIKKLVSRTLDSFKRSTDPKELSRFDSICSGGYRGGGGGGGGSVVSGPPPQT